MNFAGRPKSTPGGLDCWSERWLKRIASGLSGAPRIAQGGKPSQGVTAIDPIMHQEAFDEGEHLVLRDAKGGCDPDGEGRSPVGPRPQPALRWGVGANNQHQRRRRLQGCDQGLAPCGHGHVHTRQCGRGRGLVQGSRTVRSNGLDPQPSRPTHVGCWVIDFRHPGSETTGHPFGAVLGCRDLTIYITSSRTAHMVGAMPSRVKRSSAQTVRNRTCAGVRPRTAGQTACGPWRPSYHFHGRCIRARWCDRRRRTIAAAAAAGSPGPGLCPRC
jgi:hypothetical protein